MSSKYKTEASLSSLAKSVTGAERVRLSMSAVRKSLKYTRCIRDKKLMHIKLKIETNSIPSSKSTRKKIVRKKRTIRWRDQP